MNFPLLRPVDFADHGEHQYLKEGPSDDCRVWNGTGRFGCVISYWILKMRKLKRGRFDWIMQSCVFEIREPKQGRPTGR